MGIESAGEAGQVRSTIEEVAGKIQETACLGVPGLIVRENTEGPVTIEQATNVLAGTGREGIREAIRS